MGRVGGAKAQAAPWILIVRKPLRHRICKDWQHSNFVPSDINLKNKMGLFTIGPPTIKKICFVFVSLHLPERARDKKEHKIEFFMLVFLTFYGLAELLGHFIIEKQRPFPG